jgi:hypothetical protein
VGQRFLACPDQIRHDVIEDALEASAVGLPRRV